MKTTVTGVEMFKKQLEQGQVGLGLGMGEERGGGRD